MLDFIKKIVGTKNERELKRIQPLVEEIRALEPQYEKLADAELRAKTDEFKKRIQDVTATLRAALEESQSKAAAATGEVREDIKAEAEELEKELRQAEAKVLDDILSEAFGAVREASKRTIGLRHFDAQMIGGIFLHEGKIAEMTTGEGKTLVATLSSYLNGLAGQGGHLISVDGSPGRSDA